MGLRLHRKWIEDLCLEVCPNNIRSAEVLIPLIFKHLEIGTTIHTDNWEAYDCLSEHGFVMALFIKK